MKFSGIQKTLIEKLTGQEARMFLTGNCSKLRMIRMNGDRKEFNKRAYQERNCEETKRKIYQSFKDEQFDPDLVRTYMLKFLDFQIRLTNGLNQSFSRFKKRILDGNYDFDFSRYKNQHP